MWISRFVRLAVEFWGTLSVVCGGFINANGPKATSSQRTKRRIQAVCDCPSLRSAILDSADNFDSVVGQGRFAELDSVVLDVARSIVQSAADRGERAKLPAVAED